MKRLSLWLLFFAVLGIQSVLAQTYTVKGNVVSKTDNEPLIGVSMGHRTKRILRIERKEYQTY